MIVCLFCVLCVFECVSFELLVACAVILISAFGGLKRDDMNVDVCFFDLFVVFMMCLVLEDGLNLLCGDGRGVEFVMMMVVIDISSFSFVKLRISGGIMMILLSMFGVVCVVGIFYDDNDGLILFLFFVLIGLM